jgi:uncharacterized protein YdeI (YjbR/CyaY-like superfamily)
MPDIKFFSTHEKFRQWLERHHDTASELWLGFYRLSARKKGITYAEAVDEALCFGWIDGIRKSIDDESYTNRFTPRKPKSNWSNINVKHMARLIADGRMHPAGLKAFEARDEKRTGIYSFENKPKTLPAAYEKKLKANKKAWKFFDAQAPWYKRTASHWVMSAKQEATREKRLGELIADSANGLRVKPLRWNVAPKK